MKYTVWQELKWIVSVWLLWWSCCLLPDDSPEKIELLVFIRQHMKKSTSRQEKARL